MYLYEHIIELNNCLDACEVKEALSLKAEKHNIEQFVHLLNENRILFLSTIK